jgi:lipopolysaccharide/colanic/teichoic acid biosynthesis glycosyltransferase
MLSTLINRLLALLFLVLYSPMMILIALLIKIDSPGKAIFTQTRIGKKQKCFSFYKFRTMWVDADKKFPDLYKYNYSDQEIETMKFKISNDPRLTKFGSYLRMTSLDELPNLINVVMGDMNLIGPRPEIPEMIKYYKPWQMEKFSVKSGVTGLAQVNGRGLLTFQKTIEYDLDYIKKKNIFLDLYLFWKTLNVVLKALGAF